MSDNQKNRESGYRSQHWPVFAVDERTAAASVLESGRVNYWTGTEGRSFESEFAAFTGAKYAVALSNGTVAIELALRALGIGAGDDVIVPARTFVGTATAVVACGARPVVADVDTTSGNLTAATVDAAATRRTKCIIPVHVGGWPCNMDDIMEYAESRGLFVLEDCAQAHGARWRGRHVGNLGHVGAFSFCQDKIMTTAGEGGMLVTNDVGVWQRAWEYKDHGRSIATLDNAVSRRGHEFKWVVESFGTNWRMTEVQAAVGRVQLSKLDAWVAARRRNGGLFDGLLTDVPGLRVVTPPEGAFHSYYKYYAYVCPELMKPEWTRSRILDEINARGGVCMQGICSEIYRELAFKRAGLGPVERLPGAAELGETALMFLVDPLQDDSSIAHTANIVREVMAEATGR